MCNTDDFTKEELLEFLRTDVQYPCGVDEVIMLLAEYIGDTQIINAAEKITDLYFNSNV